MKPSRVLISVLNWNNAAATAECVDSLGQMQRDGLQTDILVIDNGSAQADYLALRETVEGRGARILRLDENLGFTGGQNTSLKIAIDEDYDYVWMLNNDATVQPDTLVKLVAAMIQNTRCGAVSPVIVPTEGGNFYNAWGLKHDWHARDGIWLSSEAEARRQQEEHPDNFCVAGTAVLLRVQALREVGLLDDRLFAYFDDNDIGVRLSVGGWCSRVVFDTTATHDLAVRQERPLYFFYLMFRNEMMFWQKNMPEAHRRLLGLKLLDHSLFDVNRLRVRGMTQQADTALLGVADFLAGRYGPPSFQVRRPPLWLRMLCTVHGFWYRKKLRIRNDSASVESGRTVV
jgi:GT2 family glycosyltransferase